MNAQKPPEEYLAPLAPLRAEGPGVRGFHAVDCALKSAAFPARPGPLLPSLSPPQSRGRREPAYRWRQPSPGSSARDTATAAPFAVSPALITSVLLCVLSGCGNERNNNAQLLRNQQRKEQTSCQSTTKTLQQRLADAEDLLVRGNVELAEATARKLLISEPSNPRVIALAAGCQANRGNFVEAAQLLDTIESDDSKVVIAALSQAADWLVEANRLDLAHRKLEQLLQTEGETNRVRHRLASVLNNQGRRIEARTHLRALARSGDATELELFAMNSFADPFIDDTLSLPEGDGVLTMSAAWESERALG